MTRRRVESTVRIRTKGGKIFDVDERIARMFGKIRDHLDHHHNHHACLESRPLSAASGCSSVCAFWTRDSVTPRLSSSGYQVVPNTICSSRYSSLSSSSRRSSVSSGFPSPTATGTKQTNEGSSSSSTPGCHPNESIPSSVGVSLDHFQQYSDGPKKLNTGNGTPDTSCSMSSTQRPDLLASSVKNLKLNGSSKIVNGGSRTPSVVSRQMPSYIKRCSSSAPVASSVTSSCCSHSHHGAHHDYYPHEEDDMIVLEKIRGGIFALMIRWAKHHLDDPLILQMRCLEDEIDKWNNRLSKVHSSDKHSSAANSSSDNPVNSAFVTSDGQQRIKSIPQWDQKFFSKLSKSQIYEMLHACSHLEIPLLTEFLAKTVADQMKGKSVEEVRKEFGIVSDYTPEEEQELKEDYERYLERLREDEMEALDGLDHSIDLDSIPEDKVLSAYKSYRS